ncbi:MAG: NAD(P)-dependent oxidoreductase [Gemmatimonadetes bacterium]|nr:NAD(P)-dependent oxidoreductase [Gemmatimonadota bacterium]
MKKILLLGAAGHIGPYIVPGLERFYELRLADVKPHPDGREQLTVDIARYEQVLDAARGMDAIFNFTVNRSHPALSFAVNLRGAYHVARAAVELGIPRILHTGPELIIPRYQPEFGIGDVPQQPGTGYYGLTKYLSMEICEIYARAYGIQTVCFQFNGLGPRPDGAVVGQDFPPFTIIWEDLVQACRLALELESVPGNYQSFNLHSYPSQGKYSLEKAERMLGYRPTAGLEEHFRRPVLKKS